MEGSVMHRRADIIINTTAALVVAGVAVGYFTSEVVHLLVDLFWPVFVGAIVLIGVLFALSLTATKVIRPVPQWVQSTIFCISLGGMVASAVALFIVKMPVTLEECPMFWPLLIAAFLFMVSTAVSLGLRTKEDEAERAAFLQERREMDMVG
jgi:hypothetical protein